MAKQPLSRAEYRRRKRRKALIIRICVLLVVAAVLVLLGIGAVGLYREIFEHEKLGTVETVSGEAVSVHLLDISEYSRSGARLAKRDVKAIVIHCVDTPGMKAMELRNYYNSLKATGANHLSSHFIIDLDGKILQCIPVNEQALANGSMNDESVSIEFCVPDETLVPTETTLSSLKKITAALVKRFGINVSQVYRHSDISRFDEITCPEFFQEDSKWQDFLAGVSVEVEVLKKKKR